MDEIWSDEGLNDSFRETFQEWVERAGGRVENTTESAVFCELAARPDRVGMRIGFYHADGRRTFRLDTVREEIELAMVSKYETDGGTLRVQSDKGSRRLELDVTEGEWTVEKGSV